MSGRPPEFSRIVPLSRVGAGALHESIEAIAAERERLASRFELVALDRLSAKVALRRQGGGSIRLDATIEAAFVQECVVSLEPVAGALAESFSLIYGPPEEQPDEIDLDVEEPAFEPLVGDAIDIGEAVAQELSLLLPVAPRDPQASIEAEMPAAPAEGPFAALAPLRKPAKD
jgi:uncharacterized metal-binding protein YceD (DUF177 family)